MADGPDRAFCRLQHRTPGRVRIAVAGSPPRARLEALARLLAGLDGVRRVEIRPVTGSILILHAPGADPLAAATSAEWVELADEQIPPSPRDPFDPAAELLARTRQLDAWMLEATNGRLDSWGLAFTGLVAAGLVQAARGQILGPAIGLFGQAAALALARPFRRLVP